MNNLVKIKSKRADQWIKHNWSMSPLDITYNRNERAVMVTLPMKFDEEDTHSVVKYPILNSSYDSISALEPFPMIDMYHYCGFIAAPGHNAVTICGLKIAFKDIGIEVGIRNVQKYKTTLYNRATFGIYPKSPADYAYFSLYFCDDVTQNLLPRFAALHGLNNKRRKINCRN